MTLWGQGPLPEDPVKVPKTLHLFTHISQGLEGMKMKPWLVWKTEQGVASSTFSLPFLNNAPSCPSKRPILSLILA